MSSARPPKFILPIGGEWVGHPVLFLKLHGRDPILLDGAKRLREIRERGLKTVAPSLTVTSHSQAVKHLTNAGEYIKAAEHVRRHFPELKNKVGELSRLAGVTQARAQQVMRALKDPSERHKLPRRAMSVVKRVRLLRDLVANGERVTLSHIDEVLGEFLE